MEDIIVFVFSVAIIISLILMSANVSLISFYNIAGAEKTVIERYWRSHIYAYTLEGNDTRMTDKILYITAEKNGELNLINRGYSDFYSVRLICWNKYHPFSGDTLNGGLATPYINNKPQPPSLEALSSMKPYDMAEYNLIDLGFSEEEIRDGNVACLVVSLDAIEPFVPHG